MNWMRTIGLCGSNENLVTRYQHLVILFMLSLLYGSISAQSYTDVATDQGISAVPNSLYYGSGMSFYDFDRDGWDDLSYTMVDDSLRFYKNVEGVFEQMPSWLFGEGQVKHLVWVDYDNDGDLDMAVTTFEGSYKLYQNDGAFNFTDVSVSAGLLQGIERYYGISFADYDRDGDLDFYVACYEQLGDDTYFSRLNHLYRNDGDGTFSNVTLEAGVGDGIRLSFKGVWFDYDKDGWPDLFVINDRVYKNSLYHNNGDGTFTDVSLDAGIQLGGQDPMTATVSDFDNDGDLDIYMTNTSSPTKRGQLLVNNNDGTFTESAADYGVDVYGWTWGALWVDYDNDTDQDLYVAHGRPNTAQFDNHNFFLQNEAGAFFTDISDTAMVGEDNTRSYSVARGDIDNDGFYDIGVLNRTPFNVNLWKNSGNDNNFIKITLTGTASNIMAIGSWIRVYINGMQYTQYTMCGENYIGQNSQHHIFGLGDASVVDSIEVEYVLGHTDSYYNLPANEHYYFTEGETFQAVIATSGSTSFCEGNSVILDAGEHAVYEWNNGHTERYLTVHDGGEYWVTVGNDFGLSAQSDIIAVEVHENPALEQMVVHPSCFGFSNGLIMLNNTIGIPGAEVDWENGMEGAELDSLPAGIYNYVFVDTNNCAASGTIFLQQPMQISVLVFIFPEVNGNDGSVTLIINGGTSPYTIFVDEIEVDGATINDLSAGTYQILIVDENGCEFTAEVVVSTVTSVNDISATPVQIFPNPVKAGQPLNLVFKDLQSVYSVRLVNSSGAEILNIQNHPWKTHNQLEIPEISSGIYRLVLELNSGDQLVETVVVMDGN